MMVTRTAIVPLIDEETGRLPDQYAPAAALAAAQTAIEKASEATSKAAAASASAAAAAASAGGVPSAVNGAVAAADIPGRVADQLALQAVALIKGEGIPNGAVSAEVGTLYIDTALVGDIGIWQKLSGAGKTGWENVSQRMSADTLAAAKAYVDQRYTLVWDASAGRYTNQSIVSMLASRRDGLAYGVLIPKGFATSCTKTASNAGIANPVPGVIGRPAIDPYVLRGAFFTMEVNGGVEPDGTPYVTAVQGDGNFARDGSNGDVWILAPSLYWRYADAGTDMELVVSDSPLPGLAPQPKVVLPSGGSRPFMLYAKYALSIVGGVARSVSGQPVATRNVSHNSLITQTKTASTGYSGKSYADDWYMKVMLLLKYATKNSQSVFAGVTSFSTQTPVTVAESGATRVIVAASAADSIPVGSAVMLGTGAVPTDRGSSAAFNTFDAVRVVRKEVIDAANTAIYVNAVPFSTTVGGQLSSAPWHTGGCDSVQGDGSPFNNLSGREPHTIQGIEQSLGMYECLGDVILNSDGVKGWEIFLNPDSKGEATSVTASYVATGKVLPKVAADASVWTMYPESAGGLLFGVGEGASSSSGTGDVSYVNGASVVGQRAFLALGNLWLSSHAGAFFVAGWSSLSSAGWSSGSRLSAIGRSRG